MPIERQMCPNQVIIGNKYSMGNTLQTNMDEDDDYPPGSRRAVACAFINEILYAWIRKA